MIKKLPRASKAFRTIGLVSLIAVCSLSALSQENQSKLLLKVDQRSSGPLGGQKNALCLRVYSDGKIVEAEWSTSAVSITDAAGKATRPEKTTAFEYQFQNDDLWRVKELTEFLESKPVQHLSLKFRPLHRSVDFLEVSMVEFMGPTPPKQLNVINYYDSSLTERTKYPPALVILMDKLASLEDLASQKGRFTEPPADCRLKWE